MASAAPIQVRAQAELERRRRERQRKPQAAPEFRGAAAMLQTTHDYEMMLAGPAETGKTFATLWKLDSLLREHKKSQAVMLRKVRATIYGSALQTYEKIIAQRGGVKPYGGQEPHWYDYANGSRLWLAGMDNPGKALSSERDYIYVNQAEEITLNDWETLLTRATGRANNAPFPLVFGDCNPGASNHWIKQRPSLRVLESRHRDNPTLYTADGEMTERGTRTMGILDSLTGLRYKRLRLGLWVSAEGVVYDTYDPAIHLIPRFDIPLNWRRIRVIDFGFNNPFVCSWYAIDHDNRMYRYREIYMTGRTVRAHAAQIQRHSAEERYEATIADHDAEDRATLAECGIETIPAYKAVKRGIEKVQERFAPSGDGKPRLFYLKDSLIERDPLLVEARKPTCTEEEIEAYVWAKAGEGRAEKEEPVKVDDHGMDATRYGVAYADGLAGASWSEEELQEAFARRTARR